IRCAVRLALKSAGGEPGTRPRKASGGRTQENGAQERTRTFTAVKPLAPEASASTNSATWAWGRLVRIGRALVKLQMRRRNKLYRSWPMTYRGRQNSPRYHPISPKEADAMASNLDTLVTVFGGSGFLGRAVVRALAKREYRLRVAVRRP